MYEFATVALLALATTKVVDLTRHVVDVTRAVRLTLGFVLGIAFVWATDYSMFAGWGIEFRDAWMGPAATGLVIGGLAAAWHELLDVLASSARRSYDQASEIESRIPSHAA